MKNSWVRWVVGGAVCFQIHFCPIKAVLAAGPTCAAPPAGLVSWWRAENNTSDSWGTNNGAATLFINYAPGKVGQAFSFGGSDIFVQVSDSPSLHMTNA